MENFPHEIFKGAKVANIGAFNCKGGGKLVNGARMAEVSISKVSVILTDMDVDLVPLPEAARVSRDEVVEQNTSESGKKIQSKVGLTGAFGATKFMFEHPTESIRAMLFGTATNIEVETDKNCRTVMHMKLTGLMRCNHVGAMSFMVGKDTAVMLRTKADVDA